MSEIIDLSQPIIDSMPIFPGDSPTRLYQSKFLDKDKHNNHVLEINMHSGTHIDSPMHMIDCKRYISEISLSSFVGKGCILDSTNKSIITMQKQYEQLVENQSIVLLFTGYDKYYGKNEYYEHHPTLDYNFCEFLVSKNIKMLGMDMPSPDYFPFKIHELLFKNNIFLIENLTNLEKLLEVKSFEVFALPLKIKADSSIARVFARIA